MRRGVRKLQREAGRNAPALTRTSWTNEMGVVVPGKGQRGPREPGRPSTSSTIACTGIVDGGRARAPDASDPALNAGLAGGRPCALTPEMRAAIEFARSATGHREQIGLQIGWRTTVIHVMAQKEQRRSTPADRRWGAYSSDSKCSRQYGDALRMDTPR